MKKYRLAHVGINCENAKEAMQAAKLFEAMFGMDAEDGESSVFAGGAVECMKQPSRGRNGHIAIAVPDVQAAAAELESKGFALDCTTKKYKPDGTLKVIYLAEEICGFAVHLTEG